MDKYKYDELYKVLFFIEKFIVLENCGNIICRVHRLVHQQDDGIWVQCSTVNVNLRLIMPKMVSKSQHQYNTLDKTMSEGSNQ